jgi:hypothetical protein
MYEYFRRLLLNARWSDAKLLEIIEQLTQLEYQLSQLRDDFNAGLAALGAAISDLVIRIAALPAADAITQADLDSVQADANALRSLAVSNPDVPVPAPGDNQVAGDGQPNKDLPRADEAFFASDKSVAEKNAADKKAADKNAAQKPKPVV